MENTDEAVLRIMAHYMAQVQAGQRPSLGTYLTSYPQYAAEISDFVAYYHVIEARTPQEMSGTDEELSDVSRVALQRAVSRVAASEATLEAKAPMQITTLFTKRNRQRITHSRMARELDLSIDIVMQLEHRMLAPASIPEEVCKRLARILQLPLCAIQAYLLMAGRRIGAAQVAEQSTEYGENADRQACLFRQALEASSQISVQQKTLWYKILKEAGL